MSRPTPWQKPFVKIAPPAIAKPAAAPTPTPVAVTATTNSAAYTEWTREEENALLTMHKCGYRYKFLYSHLTTRSRPAIRGKLQRMGLVAPRPRKPAFTP